jgi:hypothetical protein
MDELLQQGVTALQAGKREEARQLLVAAVKQNKNDERAWGWLYQVANNDAERKTCLQQILRINPQNTQVKALLDQMTAPPPMPPAQEQQTPAQPPITKTAQEVVIPIANTKQGKITAHTTAEFSFRSKVAGVTYPNADGSSRQEYIKKYCRPGYHLYLMPEPENQADRNATAVYVTDSKNNAYQIGYVTQNANDDVHSALVNGEPVNMRITEITGGTADAPNRGVNVEISIGGKSQGPTAPNIVTNASNKSVAPAIPAPQAGQPNPVQYVVIEQPKKKASWAWYVIITVLIFGSICVCLNMSNLGSNPVVTMDKFNKIQSGMSYQQVVNIIGKQGEESSRVDVSGYNTVLYMWQNGDGTNMNAMFQNDKLVSKAQFGLK